MRYRMRANVLRGKDMLQDYLQNSPQGIRLSYEKFLSDSAAGYVLALIIIIAYLADAPIPLTALTMYDVIPVAVLAEYDLLLGILIVFLGTPVGLLLNGASLFTLGSLQILLVDRWLKPHPWVKWLVISTESAWNLTLLSSKFNFAPRINNKTSFYEDVSMIEEVIVQYFPEVWASLSHVYGIKQFTRNIALICLLVACYFSLIPLIGFAILSVALGAVFVVFTSLVEYYFSIGTILKAYLILEGFDALPEAQSPNAKDAERWVKALFAIVRNRHSKDEL